MPKQRQFHWEGDDHRLASDAAQAHGTNLRGMRRIGGLMVLLLVLVSCDVSISIPTPTSASLTPTAGPSPTPLPFGHDPYLDGQPPRFLWHYPPPPEGLTGQAAQGRWCHARMGTRVWSRRIRRCALSLCRGCCSYSRNLGDESLDFGAYARIGELFTSQTSHLVTDLECERTYLFEIRAMGAGRPEDMSIDPDQRDYSSPSRVIVSPCGTEPAISVPHAGLCPEEGTDCLLPSQKVALSSGWPSFQAVYSTLRHQTWTHDCPDGQFFESRFQVKYMDFRTDYDHRTTVIGDSEWGHPELFCSGSGVGLHEGVGAYEEQKGLIRTTYNALEDSGRIERRRTLGLSSSDLTDHLGYYGAYFRTRPSGGTDTDGHTA